MITIDKNILLSNMTTLGVGGAARELVVVKNREEFIEALEYARDKKLELVVIGGGSNLLVSDSGFDGIVIVNKACGYSIEDGQVVADSGTLLSLLSKKTLEAGLTGLAFGAGIPGTIGAAVVGNVGMKYGSIADVLVSAEVWEDGETKIVNKEDLDFGYRSSSLKNKNIIVLSVILKLSKGDAEEARLKVKEDLARRASSYRGRTAGSYFKNPEGKSAGELIEQAGLKGYQIGGAEVSNDHANVFRNAGNATANDFFELEKHVKTVVKERFGVDLVPEVVKVGNFPN